MMLAELSLGCGEDSVEAAATWAISLEMVGVTRRVRVDD
jgi:hypothetical protein